MSTEAPDARTAAREQPAPGRVAVIGCGAMGIGIAQVAAQAGHQVTLIDQDPQLAARAIDTLTATMSQLVGKGRLEQHEADRVLARIDTVDAIPALPECALVIEAVPEVLELKRQVFAQLSEHQPATTVLATNTSSIDIAAIAEDVTEPERVLGLHFFNPAPVMRLVEVVHTPLTSRAYVDHVSALMQAWAKTPVRCASTPGFIVNRVARPFYGEGQRLVDAEVADPATIDAILRDRGGFPMGPFELTDFIGQDVNLAVGTSVWEQTDHDERYAPTQFQQQLVADGHLGRKSGRGVFRYAADGGIERPDPDLTLVARLVGGPIETDPLARTLAMLVNEAADLVHRGEATAADVDTAMVLGLRHPKGPIAWGAEIGFATVAEQVAALDAAFPGGRYRPSPALTDGTLT